MKRIISTFVLTLAVVLSASAQEADAIFQKYLDKTGLIEFIENYESSSFTLDYTLEAGPMVMEYKVTGDGNDKYRVEASMQGQNVLFIIRDSVAYVNAGGQVQMVDNQSQIAQMVPLKSMTDILPTADKYTSMEIVGSEGKGKKECYLVKVISKEDSSEATIYFNKASGLIEKMVSEVEGLGSVEVLLTKYTEFVDGELNIPTEISTKTPQGNIVFVVSNIEVDYPVAPWMFAAPQV